jgi:hypothetical protein
MGNKSKRKKRRAAKLKLRQQRKDQEKQKEKKVVGCDKTVFVPGVGTVSTTPSGPGGREVPVGAGGVPITTVKDDDWEVELDIVKECSKVSDNGTSVVWIEPLAKVKIDALMEEYRSQEWLAYLLGDKEDMIVKDIFIPEQIATAARVDDVDCADFNNISVIGVIHSHHGMGTGFSHTDHTYVNQNHDISLVVAHSGIAGQIRSKVPCGAMMITDAKVKMRFSVDGFEKDKFIDKVKTSIKKPVYHYTPPANQPHMVNRQDWSKDKPGVGSGYWFNGKWHTADPIKEVRDDDEVEKEIEQIHKSDEGTLAHYWTCPHCEQQNYTKNTIICWSCKKVRLPQTGAWMCSYCKGVNNRMDSTTCIFCKTVRSLAAPIDISLSEKNQKKIDDEYNKSIDGNGKAEVDTSGWTSGIPQKHLGIYACGRCGGKWEDVDLRKFTECPNCDKLSLEKTLEDELKEDFDKIDKEIEKNIKDLNDNVEEEKKRLNISATDAKKPTTTSENQPLVAGTDTPLDEDVHICRICKLEVSPWMLAHRECMWKEQQGLGDYNCKFCSQPIGVPNAYHVGCFEKKQAEVKPEDDIWESDASEPVSLVV